ncbi:DUF4192 domain-containing protein [Streptomyces sp. MUM 203J]|uniref:DUF4192 domain-containing protein n=1 Tax=Streptomyces sp. MUM 203J TaxID=2791990 RepID=UPI001F03CCDB|nr:DUF4192 domain-containing protein [Streptomyces sp. MUM 203J]MCH0540911.1 DUF4192 domain-containing protein [Streptomyces sp. MUM 203J]
MNERHEQTHRPDDPSTPSATQHTERSGPHKIDKPWSLDKQSSGGTAEKAPPPPTPSTPFPAEAAGFAGEPQITLRGPAELADALPYMFGFHPTDSAVLLALHGEHGRFGGRLRMGIPRSPREWEPVAQQLAECLVDGSTRRGARPDGIVVFLCQDPVEGEDGRRVMERLRPLAHRLRTACGALDVPVYEALCISGGRFWSYCCPDSDCCPPGGRELAPPGTSVMAAAAAYAGIHVRGSLRDMEARLKPGATGPAMAEQTRALDTASAALLHRMVGAEACERVREETIRGAEELMRRFAELPEAPDPADADDADDALLAHTEAAALIIGLQDRITRDRAAEWMEGTEAGPALRLWRALARRCTGAYGEHAAAPLALAGWVAWSTGDEPGARVALGLALEADPEYVFARLLHQACNEQLDPESLRQCLRGERTARKTRTAGTGVRAGTAHGASARRRPGTRAPRTATPTRTPGTARPGAGTGEAGRGTRSRTGGRRAARPGAPVGARTEGGTGRPPEGAGR